MTDTCATCRFWGRLFIVHGGGDGDVTDTGECRRRSPAVGHTRWPVVGPEQWCGEYEISAAELARQREERIAAGIEYEPPSFVGG